MVRRVLAPVLAAVLSLTLVARGQEPPVASAAPSNESAIKDAAAIKQERLAQQFKDFSQSLLRLAQRLESSSKPEDREKAVILKKAIEKAGSVGVDAKFDKLISILKSTKELNLDDLGKAAEQNRDLVKDIQEILNILMTDNRDAELKAERERITELLKRLNEVIRQQQIARTWTERGGKDNDQLAKDQKKVTDLTEALARALNKDGKPGDGKSTPKGDAKPSSSKDGKGEGKEDTKDPKSDMKDAQAKAEPKEPKEPMKGGPPAEAKPGKPGDQQAKAGEPKEGEPKPGEGKPGQSAGKSGPPSESKSKGENKAEAKPNNQQQPPNQQQAQAKSSQGSGQGQPKPDQPPQPPPPPQDQQSAQKTPGRKQVQDATEDQKRAEGNIKKDEKPKASEDQSEAIKKLKEAQKELERLLAQLREEELERLLAALQARCERMRQMQIEVKAGTVPLHKTIEEYADKKATRTEVQKSLQLSDREDEIVREANKAIGLLQSEGSAVAFYEVFIQVRTDMQNVANRLRKTDVGVVTQTIEQDIIDTLGEMIEALKKAQQDMKDKKNNPKPPGQNPNQNQNLIDLLAELKMIRSMQLRVNNRTITYAREYEGEQAPDPTKVQTTEQREKMEMVQQEMKNLSERQLKIFEVTNNIARGKNK